MLSVTKTVLYFLFHFGGKLCVEVLQILTYLKFNFPPKGNYLRSSWQSTENI